LAGNIALLRFWGRVRERSATGVRVELVTLSGVTACECSIEARQSAFFFSCHCDCLRM